MILTANRSVIEEKREAVVAFMRGWLKAIDFFKADRAAAAAIVSKHFSSQGFDPGREAVDLLLSKIDLTPDFTPALKDYLTKEAEILIANKQIKAVPDWNTRLDAALRDARNAA